MIRTFANVDRHLWFIFGEKGQERWAGDVSQPRTNNEKQVNALGRALLRNHLSLVLVQRLACIQQKIIQPRYFRHHQDAQLPTHTSYPRILVTTPSTLVFASLSNINCPSLTNSDWLMNSKTTLALSPVLMRPEGWSKDFIRTVCFMLQYVFS